MSQKKVYITREIPGEALKMLKDAGFDVHTNSGQALSKSELIEELKKEPFEGILSLLTDKIDGDVFDAVPSLKIVANYAVGFDNIDIAEAKKRGIAVTNTPTPLVSEAVSQQTLALIFSVVNRIVESDKFVREGEFKIWDPNIFLHPRLSGLKVGLVGVGRIGETVGHRLHKGFGMEICYFDPKQNTRLEDECGAEKCESLDELLSQSDVVSLHVPLLPETLHLIDASKLSLMKRGSYLINTARGPVVDEKALIDSLKNGHLAGAGLDVFESEGGVSGDLISLPNVVLTPHVASATDEVRNEMSRLVALNIINVLEGRLPENPVSLN